MGYNKYYLYKKQYSTDNGQTWYDVTPLETTPSGDSIGGYPTLEECGAPSPQYRTTSGTPYCTGYDKYVDILDQVSYDGGSTWETTATTTTLLEHNSTDCGYVEEKMRLLYANGGVYTGACDGSNTRLTTGNTHPAGYTYTAMTSAVIGSCVKYMDSGVFKGCTSLSSCTIGSGVTSIGYSAFSGCTSLTSIDIPDSVTGIGYSAFTYCRSMTSCIIGSGVTSIGNDAFCYCSGLTSLTIGSSVTDIGESAFYGCSGLTNVTIPDSVESIDNYAFNRCMSLTSITVNAYTPPTLHGTSTFDNTNNCPIYVPRSRVSSYKSATYWSEYSSRIQAIP